MAMTEQGLRAMGTTASKNVSDAATRTKAATKALGTKAPGKSVRGSQTGRPIMVLLDVLGQRWTLRVLWELGATRANFRALRLKCDDVSPTLLNKRLKQLRELGLIDLDAAGFGLTEQGEELTTQLVGLGAWATKWAQGLELGA
jgi:DNA-binding HxlR family transcriptional regulator